MSVFKRLLIVLVLPTMVACSTVVTKTLMEDKSGDRVGIGTPYSGTLLNAGLYFCLYQTAKYIKKPYLPLLIVPAIPVVIDTPLSLVADTVLLPIDLIVYFAAGRDTIKFNGDDVGECNVHI